MAGKMKEDARTLGPSSHSSWHRWIFPFAMIALWCSPAVAINVTHALQSGREPALIVAAVFSVFGAAMAGLRLETAGSLLHKLITTACLAVLLSFNFSNAVGLSAVRLSPHRVRGGRLRRM